MIIYDRTMSTTDLSCRKPRLGHWLGALLVIGLALLIVSGISMRLAVRTDAGPEIDWFLQPAPRHLVLVHYGRNVAYSPKRVVSSRAALPSSRAQHYVSVYFQTPQRAWSLIWLL
jgi:hypothetical protein